MASYDRRGAPSKATPRNGSRRARPRSCVWWFLFGTLLGSFGVGLYWMRETPVQGPASPTAVTQPQRPTPPQPSFTFSNILKDTVVDIDPGKPLPPPAPRPEPPPKPVEPPPQPVQPPPAAPATQPPPPPAAETPAATGSYVLQVASFKSAADAEEMKGQLALLGISTRVQSATIKNGQIWHRVMTGPFPSKQAMESARANLKRHGRDSLPIKVK